MIDADNSCLFNSVAYCLEDKRLDMAYELRELVASVVLSDPDEYNEAVLGKVSMRGCVGVLVRAVRVSSSV